MSHFLDGAVFGNIQSCILSDSNDFSWKEWKITPWRSCYLYATDTVVSIHILHSGFPGRSFAYTVWYLEEEGCLFWSESVILTKCSQKQCILNFAVNILLFQKVSKSKVSRKHTFFCLLQNDTASLFAIVRLKCPKRESEPYFSWFQEHLRSVILH